MTMAESCVKLLTKVNSFLMDCFLTIILDDLVIILECFLKSCTTEILKHNGSKEHIIS